MRKGILAILLFSAYLSAQPQIKLSFVEHNFGNVVEGDILKKELVVYNTGREPLKGVVSVSCECLSCVPEKFTILPQGKELLQITFDTEGRSLGEQKEYIYIETNDPSFSFVTIPLVLNIFPKGGIKKISKGGIGVFPATEDVSSSEGKQVPFVELAIFSTPYCKVCREITNKIIPEVERKCKIRVKVYEYSVDEPQNLEKFVYLKRKYGKGSIKLPAILLGDGFFSWGEVRDNFEEVIKNNINKKLAYGIVEGSPGGEREKIKIDIKLLPVIFAGLVDGINPCVFVVITFFITYLLFILNKPRKVVFFTGLFFIFGVFVTYFLLGLGIKAIINFITSYRWIGKIVYICIGVVTFVFGVLSFRDAAAIKKLEKGKEGKVALQLPEGVKKFIERVIRKQAKSAYFVVISFITGLIVSTLEFVCTGQVYFPTIMYILHTAGWGKFVGLFYLLVYCVMFIVPLLLIFSFLYVGVSSEKIRKFGYEHFSFVKLLLGFVFVFLSLYLLYAGITR
jgi:cytochrome c biogenesis protein CcdA